MPSALARVHGDLATAPRLTVLAFGCWAGLGCEAATDLATAGDIGVYVATTGPEPDPDGYQVRVDGASVRGLGLEDSTLFRGLEPGAHAVELIDVAGNCAVRGAGLRSATVTAGGTATVRFEITCAPTAGLRVVTASDGAPADSDGYQLVVLGRGPRPVGANETITIAPLPQGTLTLELTDLAAACAVAGGNIRQITLVAGDTAEVTFAVHCAPPEPGYGTIHVAVTTTVVNTPIPTGYAITLDGGSSRSVGPSDAIAFTHLSTGTHSVGLSGQPPYCSVGGFFPGPNPVSVRVLKDSVSHVSFGVLCLG
jgi:hypothetical protein